MIDYASHISFGRIFCHSDYKQFMIITMSTPHTSSILDENSYTFDQKSNKFLYDADIENYRVVVELNTHLYPPNSHYSRISLKCADQNTYLTIIYDGVGSTVARGPVSYNYDSDTLTQLHDVPLCPEEIVKINEMLVKMEDYYGKTIYELTHGLWDYLTWRPML